MKNLSKILPSICVILFVIFLIIWQLSDWSLIRVLPWLMLGASLTVGSFAVSIAVGKRIRLIAWIVLLSTLVVYLLFLGGIVELKMVWESLIMLGTSSIFIYLFELTRRGHAFGSYTKIIAAVPTVFGLFFMFLFLFTERFLGITLLCLVASALLAITGLLFGFRKSH